jgi:hypothetical protein
MEYRPIEYIGFLFMRGTSFRGCCFSRASREWRRAKSIKLRRNGTGAQDMPCDVLKGFQFSLYPSSGL